MESRLNVLERRSCVLAMREYFDSATFKRPGRSPFIPRLLVKKPTPTVLSSVKTQHLFFEFRWNSVARFWKQLYQKYTGWQVTCLQILT